MNKDFTLYPEAFELKQLGFDKPCIAHYTVVPEDNINWFTISEQAVTDNGSIFGSSKNYNTEWFETEGTISAPTYSEAFRWFREKHNYHVIIDFNQSKNNKWYYGIIQIDHNISVSPDVEFETYEEAELAALKELIKTIKDRT
jgi:hypothetical protein